MGANDNELESIRVARILRDSIIRGRRPPGSRLVERDIAADLHVSRVPVREAIRKLVAEGIVTARPRSWAVVREFSAKELADLVEVREPFEELVFVLAAQRHRVEDRARMRTVLDREQAAVAAGDAETARIAGAEFHEVVADLADNVMVSEVLESFRTRLRWLFAQHEGVGEIAEEHRMLYEAIVDRDVDALRRMVPDHLRRGRAEAGRQHMAGRLSEG